MTKSFPCFRKGLWLRWTPSPVIVTIRENGDYTKVLL